ncbi:MAG: hypothetical protein AABX10_01570 [Nanoarchaeota archaeon]
MVHKKYTYKGGKRFGPYYYETKRVDGHVVTTYLGASLPKKNYTLNFIATLFLLLLIASVYFISSNITGNASLNIDTNYKFGEQITGNLELILLEGELVPADSIVVVSYGNLSKELVLSDLVSNDKLDGEFYVEDASISGEGFGYGILGKVVEYPVLDFEFSLEENVEESVQESNEGAQIEPESEPEIESESETESESESSSITGEVISDSRVISGRVSKDNDFSYDLNEGDSASLVSESVYDKDVQLDDSIVSFDSSNNKVTITTDYSTEKEGFGPDYIGDKSLSLNIDISSFELIADNEADIDIKLVYNEVLIVEASDHISVSGIPESPKFETESSEPETLFTNETLVNETHIGNATGFNQTISNETSFNETFVNETVANVTESNYTVNVSTVQYGAVIGRPVKWVKTVSLDSNELLNLTLEIPASAENVIISKITDEDIKEAETSEFTEPDVFVSITGEVTADFELEKESFFDKIFKLFKLTGRVVEEETETQEISVEFLEEDVAVEVEYYTGAPVAIENVVDNNFKIVTVSSPEDVHYENVLVYTNLSDNLRVTDTSSIMIDWVENLTQLDVYSIKDTNFDGYYDYVEWIAPHLSNQTFNIIVIIEAEHLDENRTFISNIYNETREFDGIWSESILDGHYVRIIFERNLTSLNDITVYPRAANGTNISNVVIDVFEKNSNESIAQFYNLTEHEYNKIYLGALENRSQDTFDLLVLGGDVEFDHIIDPSTALNGFLGDVGLAPLTSESYVMTYLNRTGNTVQFQIMNTDGTTILQPVTIATGSGDGYNRTNNVTRVAVASINSTFFVIGWTNTSAEWRAGFKTDGTYYFSPATTDGSIGTALHEIALTAFNTTLVAYCYVDSTEGDLDMIRFDAETGTLVGSETDINSAVTPEGGLQDRADCDAVNATTVVAIDYDAGGDDDAIYHLVDYAGTEVVTDTAIDSAVGTGAQVASATIDNDKYVLAWYDQADQDITIAINDLEGNSILAATDVDTAVGTSSRLSIATVFNKTTNSDNFVVAYFNQSAGDIVAVAYNGSGTKLIPNFIVESFANTAPALYYAVGRNPATGMSLCNETWAITYTNSSDKSITKTYWLNGTLWDGNCPFIPTFGPFNETTPNNSAYVNGAVYRFNITITDSNGTAGLEFNGTNRSVSNLSATMFNSTITNLAAGTYSYYWWSYGPGSTYNVSGIRNYVIARNTSQLNLTLNGVQSNITLFTGQSILLNGTLILGDSGGDLQLYNNETLINQRSTEVSNLTLFSGIGIYNITVSYAQTQNYSQSLMNYNVTVIQAGSAPYNGTALVLNSTLGLNRTLEDLNVRTTLLDLDNNTMNVTVRWYNNSILHLTQAYNSSYSNGTAFIATLDDGNTTKGQNWSAALTIHDGTNSFYVNSSNLTILNSLPNVTLLTPSNGSITLNRTNQNFTWVASDDDGDVIVQDRINISLVAASTCTDPHFDGTDIYEPETLGSYSFGLNNAHRFRCLIDNGDYYRWSVATSDSSGYGPYSGPFNISVQAYLDIRMNISSIDFGNLDYLKNNDTTDNSPKPIIMINEGNVLNDISIKASSLWRSVSGSSAYYQAKVDNVSSNGISENGSFDWSGSITAYINIPLSAIALDGFIVNLNYTDVTDSAEIDINVTVPPTEGPGFRNSTIIFGISLGTGDAY